MESGAKRGAQRPKWGGILGLAHRIPQKDVRKLLWALLNGDDREVVRCAHNSRRAPALEAGHEERFVARGHLALLKWSFASFKKAPQLRLLAARHGHLDVLQWLADDDGSLLSGVVCGIAARNGHVHILKWAHACNSIPTDIAWHAAAHGQLQVLRWWHSVNGELTSNAFCAAARRGNMEIMEWLHSVGCPWNEHVRAVAKGEALAWLEQHGAP